MLPHHKEPSSAHNQYFLFFYLVFLFTTLGKISFNKVPIASFFLFLATIDLFLCGLDVHHELWSLITRSFMHFDVSSFFGARITVFFWLEMMSFCSKINCGDHLHVTSSILIYLQGSPLIYTLSMLAINLFS